MKRAATYLVILLILTTAAGAGADRRPLTFDDLANMLRVADPQVSPDGRWVAYSVTTVDKAKNTSNSDIWLVPISGGEPRQLTRSPQNDSRPRWSPDSRQIAFVSRRDGS